MLKDRVKINDGHFHVMAEDPNRKLYYGCVYFKDGKNIVPQMEEISYWDQLEAIEIKPKSNSAGYFLYLEERNFDEVLDSCKVFMPSTRRGGILRVKMDKPCRYGKNACRITIYWENCPGEAIHTDYVWLEDCNDNRYPFLVDRIEPMESKKSELMDQYIFTIPDGMRMSEFRVVFDSDIQEKYKVIY